MLMLIRDAQLRAMAQLRGQDFRAGVQSILDRRCPGWSSARPLPPENQLDAALAEAKRRGILGEKARAKYVIFALALGDTFERQLLERWQTPALRAATITPDERMETMSTELLQSLHEITDADG
jgi:hypothetical protein